jgi:hypothetical protein
MDAIEKLAQDAASYTLGLEKEAINWGGIGRGLQRAAKPLAPLVTRAGTGANAGKRVFSGGRTAATAAGIGALGYGGYGTQQGISTARGTYDKGPAAETPGWRRAGRQYGDRSFFGDLIRNPGRTIAEGLGYGAEGPTSTSTPGEKEVLRSGNGYDIIRQNKTTTWRPDLEAQRQKFLEAAKALQSKGGDSIFEGLDLPSQLGARAARYPIAPVPRGTSKNPLRYNYGAYNYGV